MATLLKNLCDDQRLSPGDPQRNVELYTAGKAYHEDWTAYQNPAGLLLSTFKSERAVQGTHPAFNANVAERVSDRNKGFKSARAALGAPHSRRFKILEAIVCKEEPPSKVGAITTKHRLAAGHLALGDLQTALTDLLHHYRATGRLKRQAD